MSEEDILDLNIFSYEELQFLQKYDFAQSNEQ